MRKSQNITSFILDFSLELLGSFQVFVDLDVDNFVVLCTELGELNPVSTIHLDEVVGSRIVLDLRVGILEFISGFCQTVQLNLVDRRSALLRH